MFSNPDRGFNMHRITARPRSLVSANRRAGLAPEESKSVRSTTITQNTSYCRPRFRNGKGKCFAAHFFLFRNALSLHDTEESGAGATRCVGGALVDTDLG